MTSRRRGQRVALVGHYPGVVLTARTGRVVRADPDWAGHVIVRLDRPARHGHALLPELRVAEDNLRAAPARATKGEDHGDHARPGAAMTAQQWTNVSVGIALLACAIWDLRRGARRPFTVWLCLRDGTILPVTLVPGDRDGNTARILDALDRPRDSEQPPTIPTPEEAP